MKNLRNIAKTIFLFIFIFNFSVAKTQWFYNIDISPQNPNNNDSINVISVVGFNLGYGLSCPHVTYYTNSLVGLTIELDLFYDVSGAWTQASCYTVDTSNIGVYAPDNYSLIVTINKFAYGDTTFNTDTESLEFSVTNSSSIFEENLSELVKLYPIPTENSLFIDIPKHLEIKSLTLFNLQGKRVMEFDPNLKEINLSECFSGLYFLNILTNEGSVKKKVLIK